MEINSNLIQMETLERINLHAYQLNSKMVQLKLTLVIKLKIIKIIN